MYRHQGEASWGFRKHAPWYHGHTITIALGDVNTASINDATEQINKIESGINVDEEMFLASGWNKGPNGCFNKDYFAAYPFGHGKHIDMWDIVYHNPDNKDCPHCAGGVIYSKYVNKKSLRTAIEFIEAKMVLLDNFSGSHFWPK
jgi:hypothetical protein